MCQFSHPEAVVDLETRSNPVIMPLCPLTSALLSLPLSSSLYLCLSSLYIHPLNPILLGERPTSSNAINHFDTSSNYFIFHVKTQLIQHGTEQLRWGGRERQVSGGLRRLAQDSHCLSWLDGFSPENMGNAAEEVGCHFDLGSQLLTCTRDFPLVPHTQTWPFARGVPQSSSLGPFTILPPII